ncbi:hypothetical protein TEA_007591 [Camellia sinensis var. sinensis]|uniref:RRM domain-containing protein n=1 Tax=Camellia sinensis var. sinensis TaxID=542762 RepID=A0A4S4D5E2_CAMSN|nr:hypothetical protein TEA_007591 [Camellia sinensis var. sinensis]
MRLFPNFREKKMSSRASRTLYVGNLPGDIREREVEDLFYKYGRIVDIDLKIPPRPPGYAFVEFEDYRDAEDAIRGRDGYNFDGNRLRVELAHGGRGSSSVDRYSSYSGGSSRGGVSRRSDYRVLVTGLPSSASWQDLKDHMRRAGDVCFSQVFRDRDVVKCTWLGFVKSHFAPVLTGFMVGKGILTNFGISFEYMSVDNGAHHKLDMSIGELNGMLIEKLSLIAFGYARCMRGIVDYTNSDDMKYAIRKLDDSLFRNQFSRAYIRVMEYGSRSPSRSPYYSRSRSPSRSYSYSSRSRSKSPRAKYSHRSPYRSRSRSVSSRPHSESSLRSASSILFILTYGFVPSEFSICSNALSFIDLMLNGVLFSIKRKRFWYLDPLPYPAFCGDLELHVRDLMGNGAQIPASHLVVECMLVVYHQPQVSNVDKFEIPSTTTPCTLAPYVACDDTNGTTLHAFHLDQDPDPHYHCLLVTKGSVVVQSTVPAGAQAEAAVGTSLVPVHHCQDLVEVDWSMCSVSCENNEF